MIIISDCVLQAATCEIIKIFIGRSFLNLEPCEAGLLLFVCVMHDRKKLFMHSYHFLNLISKYLKCAVKIYFLTLPGDCFLLHRRKKIKIINHLQLSILMCIFFLVSVCFSDLHQTRGIYCLFLILIRLCFIFCILSEDRWFGPLSKLYWIRNGHRIMEKMLMATKVEVEKDYTFCS